MGKANFTEEFKRDAVRQITERGLSGSGGLSTAGGSPRSLYEWKKKFGKSNVKSSDKAREISRVKKELTRLIEERDILKKAAAYFARDAK